MDTSIESKEFSADRIHQNQLDEVLVAETMIKPRFSAKCLKGQETSLTEVVSVLEGFLLLALDSMQVGDRFRYCWTRAGSQENSQGKAMSTLNLSTP